MGGRGTSSVTQGKDGQVRTIRRDGVAIRAQKELTSDTLDTLRAKSNRSFNSAQRRKDRRTKMRANDGSIYTLAVVKTMPKAVRDKLGLIIPDDS